jgi:predicted short-subunit dehydrogenase-like oxidoreductase (DUF2520 family)
LTRHLDKLLARRGQQARLPSASVVLPKRVRIVRFHFLAFVTAPRIGMNFIARCDKVRVAEKISSASVPRARSRLASLDASQPEAAASLRVPVELLIEVHDLIN